MGIAEVIPGVSGGTIAFVGGIYERLLNAIKSLSPKLLTTFKSEGFDGVWKAIDGLFLVQLFFGMGLGIGVGIFGVTYILDNYPLLLWSFFFGLILASCYYIGNKIENWNIKNGLLLILGAVFAFGVTTMTPSGGTSNLLFVYLSGVIAISALMLPGLSGSFILLILGMYSVIIPAVKETLKMNFDFLPLTAVFCAGCLTGVILFSNLISWTYKNYPNATLAVLTGFMLGSLNKIWPWQSVLSVKEKDGEFIPELTKSVSPSTFSQLTENIQFFGTDPKLLACIVLMVLGAGLVLILHFTEKSNKTTS